MLDWRQACVVQTTRGKPLSASYPFEQSLTQKQSVSLSWIGEPRIEICVRCCLKLAKPKVTSRVQLQLKVSYVQVLNLQSHIVCTTETSSVKEGAPGVTVNATARAARSVARRRLASDGCSGDCRNPSLIFSMASRMMGSLMTFESCRTCRSKTVLSVNLGLCPVSFQYNTSDV